jgi:ATP-dependent RNA helicase RhlE
VDLSAVEFFVLDEVDRMLDMGFLRDVKRIIQLLPATKQSLFFSATLATNIVTLAQSILKNPARVTITPEVTTAERIQQRLCFVDRGNKMDLLRELLEKQSSAPSAKLTIVFNRTKHGANKIAKALASSGIAAEAIHGNKSQNQREKSLARFKQGLVPVLVATDVAARGVDVKDVGLVVNYDLPNEPEAYVHRIGRTGRAGAEGLAVSFCAEDEIDFLRDIEKTIRTSIPRHTSHAWHSESLREKHSSGYRPPVVKQGSRPPQQSGRASQKGRHDSSRRASTQSTRSGSRSPRSN